MKTKTLTLAIASLLLASSLTLSAQQADKKASSARKDITKGEHKLDKAKRDSAANYQNFKIAGELKIIKNEKSIVKLKSKKANDNKDVQAEYDKNVLALEQKNNNLRDKLNEYNTSDKSVWLSFKKDFNTSMDELEKSISNLK
ncbi:MAG: hypothetical protein ABI448_11205 [Bacteroidia bacterium]